VLIEQVAIAYQSDQARACTALDRVVAPAHVGAGVSLIIG